MPAPPPLNSLPPPLPAPQHAHVPPIIHRDLKSPNLLVDKHWRVKVSDFNLSKMLEDNVVMSSMAATNPRWLAPEILAGENATFASDVYAYGVVLWVREWGRRGRRGLGGGGRAARLGAGKGGSWG